MRFKNYFIFKISFYILVLISGVKFMFSDQSGLVFIGIIIFGLINAHGVQLLHQASHYKAFKNRYLNDIVGVILGLNSLVPFHKYRRIHIAHHKKLGTIHDEEIFGFENLNRNTSIVDFILKFFGIEVFNNLRKSINWNLTSCISELSVVFYFMALLLVGILGDQFHIFIYWIVSLIFITEPIHFLVELPEHFGCSKFSLDKTQNTRSILSPWLVTKWFTNYNNYHSEHHRYPNLLPEELYKVILKRKHNSNTCMSDYIQFYKYYFFKKDNKGVL